MYKSQCMINESSKNMLAHALLPLLVFEHGFTQIRFSIFDFFCFCFMIDKYFLILSNFTRYLFSVNTIFYWWETYRSSHPEVFCEKGVLGNFTKFTRKHLYQSLFFNKVAGLRLDKRLWHRCFPVNFVKFLRTPFLTKISGWPPQHIRNECWILK